MHCRKADFAFINRGVGGQDAPEELARLDSDVLAIRPQLVIWQVGRQRRRTRRNHQRASSDSSKKASKKLKTAGADVILMDNQRSPRIMAAPEHNVMTKPWRTSPRNQA